MVKCIFIHFTSNSNFWMVTARRVSLQNILFVPLLFVYDVALSFKGLWYIRLWLSSYKNKFTERISAFYFYSYSILYQSIHFIYKMQSLKLTLSASHRSSFKTENGLGFVSWYHSISEILTITDKANFLISRSSGFKFQYLFLSNLYHNTGNQKVGLLLNNNFT